MLLLGRRTRAGSVAKNILAAISCAAGHHRDFNVLGRQKFFATLPCRFDPRGS
jgi:hypothetical protein